MTASANELRTALNGALRVLGQFMVQSERIACANAIAALPASGVARAGHLRDVLRVFSTSWLFASNRRTQPPSDLLANELGITSARGTWLTVATVGRVTDYLCARASTGRRVSRG